MVAVSFYPKQQSISPIIRSIFYNKISKRNEFEAHEIRNFKFVTAPLQNIPCGLREINISKYKWKI